MLTKSYVGFGKKSALQNVEPNVNALFGIRPKMPKIVVLTIIFSTYIPNQGLFVSCFLQESECLEKPNKEMKFVLTFEVKHCWITLKQALINLYFGSNFKGK